MDTRSCLKGFVKDYFEGSNCILWFDTPVQKIFHVHWFKNSWRDGQKKRKTLLTFLQRWGCIRKTEDDHVFRFKQTCLRDVFGGKQWPHQEAWGMYQSLFLLQIDLSHLHSVKHFARSSLFITFDAFTRTSEYSIVCDHSFYHEDHSPYHDSIYEKLNATRSPTHTH